MKKIVIVLLTAILAMPLCAGGQSENGSSEDGSVTLTAIHTYNLANRDQDARIDAWYAMQEEMTKAYPKATIEFEYIPHDAYQDKAQILAAANELPDLFEVKGSWTNNFVTNNRLLSLDDIMSADTAWSGAFKDGVLKNFTVDGSVYAIGLEGGGPTHVVYYNTEILKEAGYSEFPEDFDEFKTMIGAIAAKGYTPISLGNKSNWVAESCYLSTIGNRMTGAEWTDSITARSGASFTNPKFIESLKVLVDLAEVGAFNSDMNSVEYTQQRTAYYNGKAAMFIEGGWAVNHVIENSLPEVLAATDITDFPEIQGQTGSDNLNTGGTCGWGIGVNAAVAQNIEKKDMCTAVLKLFSNMDNAVKLSETGRIPSMKVTDFNRSGLQDLNIKYLDYVNRFKPAPTYDLVWDPAVIETLNSGLQMLLIGKVSPEVLAVNVQKEYERSGN